MNESLEQDLQVKLNRLNDINFHTGFTAKEVIVNSRKLGIEPNEYMRLVQNFIHKLYRNKGE